ncbi:MAG: tyrosine-type recombinase/integrase [Proteobacteria bacterium]|nr:tyrosine-type recombinase/integrase [Pseudomonadota bacterium]
MNTALDNPYLHAATSENTRQAYRNDIKHFCSWGGLLPASPEMVIRYLKTYASLLNPRTLLRRLTAIKHWHTYQGFSDPTAYPLVRKTLSGIANVHGKPKQKATALTIENLRKLVMYMEAQNTLKMQRNNAILQVGFFGALRVSELTDLKYENIKFVAEGMEILIPRSKTDPTGQGQYCAIPFGNNKLCAVKAIENWFVKANITCGYAFRKVDKHQRIGDTPLTHKSISIIIKNLAQICQLPEPQYFSSHSLRRGFATSASRKGASILSIMRQGRWRHEGTVLGYIEEAQRFEDNAADLILKKLIS